MARKMMEFQKLKFRNFFCVLSLDSKVSLEKNIPPGTMIAKKIFYEKKKKIFVFFLYHVCTAYKHLTVSIAIISDAYQQKRWSNSCKLSCAE